jgi:phosphate transport system substrate-binding protein
MPRMPPRTCRNQKGLSLKSAEAACRSYRRIVTSNRSTRRRRILPLAIPTRHIGCGSNLEASSPRPPTAPPTPTPPPPLPERKVLLRLAGSNTIGGELAPALVKGYLVSRGAAHVETQSIAKDEMLVTGDLDGDPISLKIAAHGTVTGFKALAEGSTDIGDASRQMNTEEEQSLRPKEIARAFGSEYVIGLDGIAVIVNKGNQIDRLTIEQLGRLFSGSANSWGDVGGQSSWPVHLYARNVNSGTWETFDQIVLHNSKEALKLSSSAERIEDSAELSDKVSRDPYGIGFVGLPFIRASKALSVSAVDRAYYPTLYTVRTETYPLSRRLYMYAPRASSNPEIARFLQFVGSTAGQKILEQVGFVSLDVTPPAADELAAIVRDLPSLYQQLFAQIGPHVPFETTIHFRTDSSVIDSRGKDDLTRILAYIANKKLSPQDLVLIGHADGTGQHKSNCILSENRAKAVSDELAAFGLHAKTVTGFCESVPIAPNATEAGREKNRRVEVWRAKI